MKKTKVKKQIEEIAADEFKEFLEICFNKWAEEKTKIVDDALKKIVVESNKAKIELTESQRRHMTVIEEFLKIQTEIFQRLEKKLK